MRPGSGCEVEIGLGEESSLWRLFLGLRFFPLCRKGLDLATGRVLYVIVDANETGRLFGVYVSASRQSSMMCRLAPVGSFVAVIWGMAVVFQGAPRPHSEGMGRDWREIANHEKERPHTFVWSAVRKVSLSCFVGQDGFRV